MILDTLKPLRTTRIRWERSVLEGLPCGLFRAPLAGVQFLMPEMTPLLRTAPGAVLRDPDQYEIDIKIHMLFAGQYPCIPNWHCDHVPRTPDLDYSLASAEHDKMFLWISGPPYTEFLASPMPIGPAPLRSHEDVRRYVQGCVTKPMRAQKWCSISQLTPHRGTPAEENCWRVFARITHKDLAPQRPVNHHIRRHAQVYLDASTFSW